MRVAYYRQDYDQADSYIDAHVGDIEYRKGDEIELQKVGDTTPCETVEQISQGATNKKTKG